MSIHRFIPYKKDTHKLVHFFDHVDIVDMFNNANVSRNRDDDERFIGQKIVGPKIPVTPSSFQVRRSYFIVIQF